jgi:hypothetical protein
MPFNLNLAGSVPDSICLLADCCVADESSVFEEEESMDCLDSKHSFYLDLKSISEDNDTYNDDGVQKIKIVYDDDSYIFSNDTAITVAATFSDSSVGNASIDSEECFANKVKQPVLILKGQKLCPPDMKRLSLSARPTRLALYAVGVFFEYYLTLALLAR